MPMVIRLHVILNYDLWKRNKSSSLVTMPSKNTLPTTATKICYVTNCGYTTTPNTLSNAEMLRDLKMHLRCVHGELYPDHKGAAQSRPTGSPDLSFVRASQRLT